MTVLNAEQVRDRLGPLAEWRLEVGDPARLHSRIS